MGEKGKFGKAGVYLLLGAGVLLALLLIFGGNAGTAGKEPPSAAEDAGREILVSYRAEAEERVRALLGSMQGVGQVRVAITLEGGYEKEYASVGSSLTLIRMKTPQIKGIAVVCGGGEKAEVKKKITEALCALYHLDSTRISVSG